MTAPRYDVLGIGNAIVDVVARTDDAFLLRHGLAKGAMTLIDAPRAEILYAAMPPAVETSGGSAANTIAALASLGGRGAFVGKVHGDQLGRVFRHDIRALGVAFDSRDSVGGAPTARCLILVTPDAQRTMQTFLGACVELGPDDVDPAAVGAAAVTYLEGYLWDPPGAQRAFVKAAQVAHAAGRLVALSLSDAFCVERHRETFLELIENHVDILFANESEVIALTRAPGFDEALQAMRGRCSVAALTRSERGSVVVADGDVHVIDAVRPERLVDTTGAGDAYAAGFLFGLSRGQDLPICGRLGALAASEIIAHVGARPQRPLKALAAPLLGPPLQV
ncbi:MAG: adenosine kinase [Alphaproteobacteria bacterium]|nr:adenosine kinase [Alphaproteobacteria bacterium]